MRLLRSTAFVLAAATGATADPTSAVPGFSVTRLVPHLPTPMVAPGPGTGGFSRNLYVTTSLAAEVFEVDRAGVLTPFSDLTSIVPFGPVYWPSFDRVGLFGGSLFVVDDSNTPPDGVYRADAHPVRFGDGPGTDNDAAAFDPFGAFGGALFVHDGANLHALFLVTPGGDRILYATGVPDGAGQIAFSSGGAFGAAIYIAGGASRKIFRIPADHALGEPAPVWIDFAAQGQDVRPAGIAIGESCRFGSATMYINDPVSRSILMFGASGQLIGPFVTGISAGTIQLPGAGPFGQTMVLAENVQGNLWLVEPDCGADVTGDGALNLFDFLGFQAAFGNELDCADLAAPFGVLNLFDFLAFQTAFGNGCE